MTPVRFTPPGGYQLGVEVIAAAELRARVARLKGRGFERIDFHCLLVVTSGTYTHTVDFETYKCTRGSVVQVQPGQVHRFGDEPGWAGWFVILRSDLPTAGSGSMAADVASRTAALPAHLRTSGGTNEAVIEALERMARDTVERGDARLKNELLIAQFHSLIARLQLVHVAVAGHSAVDPRLAERYRYFFNTAEREFRRWHGAAPYAAELGYSVKSLDRATLAVAGVTTKEWLVARIVLEAQRLLAHTTLPVSAISQELGFDEATNFVKFFRRETGVTPGLFRSQRPAV